MVENKVQNKKIKLFYKLFLFYFFIILKKILQSFLLFKKYPNFNIPIAENKIIFEIESKYFLLSERNHLNWK